MRAFLWLIVCFSALLCGCPPSLDFTVVAGDAGPGVDSGGGRVDAGGGRVDAGGRDSGGSGGGVLLASSDCESWLASTVFDEDFLDTMTEFRNLSGSYRVEGGEIVFEAPSDYSFLESLGAFRDKVSCSRVSVGRASGMHRLGTGMRGPMHGVNLVLIGDTGRARLISIEPSTNVVVDERPIATWTSGRHDFTVLLYLSGTRVYTEVKDETTGEVVVLGGTYGGEQDAVNATFEGSPLAEEVSVDRVVVGPPTSAALVTLGG